MAQKETELRGCIGCGRDTKAKDQICIKCRVGGDQGPTRFASSEYKDRSYRSSQLLGGTPIVEDDEDLDCDRRSDREYHGGSVRDDI